MQKMADKGLITEQERRAFASGNGGKLNPQFVEWLMGYEQNFTEKLIPTPRACAHSGTIAKSWKNSGGVHDSRIENLLEVTPLGRIGRMNPNWIEWLMGYPIGWTE